MPAPPPAYAHSQTRRGVGRMVTTVFASVIVVIQLQLEAAKKLLHADPSPPLRVCPAWCWQPTSAVADLNSTVRTAIRGQPGQIIS